MQTGSEGDLRPNSGKRTLKRYHMYQASIVQQMPGVCPRSQQRTYSFPMFKFVRRLCLGFQKP